MLMWALDEVFIGYYGDPTSTSRVCLTRSTSAGSTRPVRPDERPSVSGFHRSEILGHVVSAGSPLAPVEGLLTMTDARPLGADEATFIAVVRSGDTARFALITERHRRELQVHC